MDEARQDLRFERLGGMDEDSEEHELESESPEEQDLINREKEKYRLNHEFYFEDENGSRVE
ncbi:MAG: hypothetical protein ACQESA_01325 [Patescibacteria group bacterium]